MRDEKQKMGNRYNDEVKGLLEKKVHETTKVFEDLPIIHTGCDTYASIYPEFKHFNRQAEVEEVVEHLLSLTPNGKWTQDNGQQSVDRKVYGHPGNDTVVYSGRAPRSGIPGGHGRRKGQTRH